MSDKIHLLDEDQECELIATWREEYQSLRPAYGNGFGSAHRLFAINRYPVGSQESDDWEDGRRDGVKQLAAP